MFNSNLSPGRLLVPKILWDGTFTDYSQNRKAYLKLGVETFKMARNGKALKYGVLFILQYQNPTDHLSDYTPFHR